LPTRRRSSERRVIGLAPDSNGSLANVVASFNAVTGDAPRRNKLNFKQNGLLIPYDYDIWHEKHFQGIQRIPRTLPGTSDASPRFVLSGSDNADLFTVEFDAASSNMHGLVGALPDTPAPNSRAIAVQSVGRYLDGNGRGHLGGLQVSGKWLAGGVEQGGGSGPSTLQFWDLTKLPSPAECHDILHLFAR
jgi:hypothetical protein